MINKNPYSISEKYFKQSYIIPEPSPMRNYFTEPEKGIQTPQKFIKRSSLGFEPISFPQRKQQPRLVHSPPIFKPNSARMTPVYSMNHDNAQRMGTDLDGKVSRIQLMLQKQQKTIAYLLQSLKKDNYVSSDNQKISNQLWPTQPQMQIIQQIASLKESLQAINSKHQALSERLEHIQSSIRQCILDRQNWEQKLIPIYSGLKDVNTIMKRNQEQNDTYLEQLNGSIRRNRQEISEIHEKMNRINREENKSHNLKDSTLLFDGNTITMLKGTVESLKMEISDIRASPKYRVSPIKCQQNAILLSYLQQFQVQGGQMIRINQRRYYVDQQGHILDPECQYLLDRQGRLVRLEEGHLKILRDYGILRKL